MRFTSLKFNYEKHCCSKTNIAYKKMTPRVKLVAARLPFRRDRLVEPMNDMCCRSYLTFGRGRTARVRD